MPTNIDLTSRTSSSLYVTWEPGYNGGEEQRFYVSHMKTSSDKETFSERITEGMTYNVTGLESYTQYEIKVYAENDVGMNPNSESILEYTLRKFQIIFLFFLFVSLVFFNLFSKNVTK